MSSSKSRDEMAVGVGDSADKVRRTLPLWFTNSNKRFGERAGPRPSEKCKLVDALWDGNRTDSPFDLGGRRMM